ncbi:hypothetical protein GMDG_01716 [Pseudogymnoascus destructans 20631-21]|uniref:Uncharacterized protein n=1 Tax=Pseudogymnoascus destructans (strain ATCC MYA-4855 / 20631-21) TaxID=658429 RepID=L8G0B4_PSED2|nr:hypothetical protein GMDG_01716 [Pseudogymnoascus destructans 20631-21]
MFIDQPRLSRREMKGAQMGQVIGSIILGLAASVIAYYFLRRFRRSHSEPTYLPTAYLKRKWIHWDVPQSRMSRTDAAHLEPISSNSTAGPNRGQPPSTGDSSAILSAPFNFGINSASNSDVALSSSAIDRNTSLRSIATLPEYAFYPKSTEQVLGRAGERDGIDTVVKFPDIAEAAEEERREDEMEALYQVRLARREEIAAREERRRLRREARDRGDLDTLAELRTRGRPESNTNLDALRAEHSRLRERERAVSQVSYEGLGVAHLDGSRVRANSEESERPLLGDAGDMGAGGRASMGSVLTFDNTARYSERYSEDDPGRPPMYDEISLGAGRDVPPGYMPSAYTSGGNSTRTRPDLPLSSHPVTELDLGLCSASPPIIERRASASPPVPFPDIEEGYDTDDAAELNRLNRLNRLNNNSGSGSGASSSGATTAANTSSSRRASATFIDPIAQRGLSPSPGRRVSPPRHVQLPRTASFPAVASEGGLTPPSQSPSPTPPGAAPGGASGGSSGAGNASGDPAPRRMSTLARRRISVNDLMGTVGRAAEDVVPQKTSYVLHTPPMPSTTPPLGERRRSSFMGLPRLGGGGGGNGGQVQGGLGVGPSIVVESATPVVGPGGGGGVR